MNLGEIKKVLDDMLAKEPKNGGKRNIVFWYDEGSEFVEDIDEITLQNGKVLKLYDNNAFKIKYYIELEDTESNLLVYSPMPRPSNSDNWLLDILKYSSTFATDKTSLIMHELKIDNALRPVMVKYYKFFDNKDRYKRFVSYGISEYTERKIDIAILSALCKLTTPNLETALKTLIIEMINGDNTTLESIAKFASVETLWELIRTLYGYKFEENNLESFSIMLLLTHLAYALGVHMPKSWQTYVAENNTNAYVFVDNFMNHTAFSKDFDNLSMIVAEMIKLDEYTTEWDIEKYIDCDTFIDFDRAIIERIKTNLVLDIGEFEKYHKIINARRTSHWFVHLEQEYLCLYHAVEMLRMEKELGKEIKGTSPAQLIELYTKEYYLIDHYYRHFINAFDHIENKESFMKLFERVENTYTYWFLNELSVKWSNLIDDELTHNWSIAGIESQQNFFASQIKPYVSNNERAFVIISDALRYEVGSELCQLLNTEQKGSTELSYCLGVVPSYTKLGMAALLPHQKIDITDKADVLIDGWNTAGTDNRDKILRDTHKDSVAVTFDTILKMKKADMREAFDGKKLVYIYHNAIDARGDNSSTEKEVFDAVDKCFDEVGWLVKTLKNNVSAINIIITADHGFIYKRTPLIESDKTQRDTTNSIEAKRRFILTNEDSSIDGTQAFDMKYLLGEGSELKALIPRSVNCFKLQGSGSNYVHGGASLQEIVIPIIKFKSDRSKLDRLQAKKVSVQLTNISRKVTSIITYLEFFQAEKVEDKKVPVRLKLYFSDESGNRISNENIIIADSKSIKPDDRTYKEKFTLKNMVYDKNKNYYLMMEDEDEAVEKVYQRIPFIIDIIFANDFGF